MGLYRGHESWGDVRGRRFAEGAPVEDAQKVALGAAAGHGAPEPVALAGPAPHLEKVIDDLALEILSVDAL